MITMADLFEAAVTRVPGATAVEAGDQSLSYAELDARANRLAHRLRAAGVDAGATVGVCMGRSVDLAVALLAVLKAGGACVPLDPAYPAERLAFMVDDAGVAAVITGADGAGRLPAGGAPSLDVDADDAAWPATPPPRPADPEQAAYVIYTSGSTGRPKGVMLTHRGLVNHHRAVIDLYELGPGDRVLQFCSMGFDASIEEMFPTWAAGTTVVFRPDDVPLLGRPWLEWLRARRISVLNLPTAYWHAWTRDLQALGAPVPEALRLLVVGGEKALGPVYRAWAGLAGGRSRWINAYGPTETTCMSTFYEAPAGADWLDPPIGRPLPNTTVVVVDDGLRPVADGVVGELLIGGAGLARGYLNRPDLTAERFVGGMYRTGDLVRVLPSGDLDYVGRVDEQVKIHGFRVECGEVEAVLARHPAIAAAAVVAREDRLVAYVSAPGAAVAGAELRRFLADRLPAHMVPAAFVILDALPLTENGKIDRDALPDPRPAGGGGPRTPAEDRMAVVWASVLGLEVDALGPGDDFFDLGGHSLLATQVIARVREEFGTSTPLRAIFEEPTLGGLTALVDAEGGGEAGPAPLVARQRRPGEALPLSLAQEQMWRLVTTAQPPGLQNITALHRFPRRPDEGALRAALAHLVDRHEALRTGIAVTGGEPSQFVAGTAAVELAVTHVGDLPQAVAEHNAAPFDLARPPLFRVGLFDVAGGSGVLVVTIDHVVCDGTGIAVFVHELLETYEALVAGFAPVLVPLPVQFADFAVWQRSQVTDEVLARQLRWWAGALEGAPLGPAVPFDHVPSAPTRRITSRSITAPAPVRAGLDRLARATGSTVFTVATAAVGAVLGGAGGRTDVVMSTTTSGRNRAEVEGLVGMFSGISRIRTDLSGNPPFVEVVERSRDWIVGMFENSDIPFMRVRRALMPDFPTDGSAVAAALPVELQYFRTRPETDVELFFRGQLHPLSITLLDDGTALSGEVSYKLDFYEPETVDALAGALEAVLAAVASDPSRRLSDLPLSG